MAWITTISPDRASGELADTYAQIAAARGGVAQVHQVQSLNPRAMAAHFELYKSIVFQGSSLTRAQREGLAVTVSRANGCTYCEQHHVAALARLPDGGIPLSPSFAVWAERLAREPERCSAADIEELRQLGLDDRAILDAVLTVAYFSFVNRVVLALGVSLETGFEMTCRPD